MGFGLKYKNEETVFEEKIMEGVPLLTYPLLEKTEFVTHGFTTRMGGVSEGYCSTHRKPLKRTGKDLPVHWE